MTRRLLSAAAVAAVSLLLAPGAAGAHGVAAPSNLSERQLRAFETRLLGAQHAREHANLRRLERKEAAAARRHARWLRSLPLAARRAAERRARLRKREAAAKNRAFLSKQAELTPAIHGQWDPAGPFPLQTASGRSVMGINAATLPSGKVLLYSYPTNPNPTYGAGTDSPNEATAFLWDPGKGTGASSFQEFAPPEDPGDPGHPANIWCSGISFNSDGTILVTGGNYRYEPDWEGLDTVYTFNPFTETWHYEGKMLDGRWYPTQVLLPDGRTAIMSGYGKAVDSNGKASHNLDIEVYDPSKPAGQRIYRVATRTSNSSGSSGHPPDGGLYPHMFLMPSGNVLVAGPFIEDSWLFDADVPSSPTTSMNWTNVASVGTGFGAARDQLWGTGVIVPSTNPASPSTKVMLLGGSFPDYTQTDVTDHSIRGTEVIDETNLGAGWDATSDLNVGRGHANTVILPDGSMVTVGGGYGVDHNNQWLTNEGSHRQVELWDPLTKIWTLGPAQVEDRAYHSTAVLLPDGRVLSSGDDWNGNDGSGPVQGGTYGISRDTAEIYSPPYLFKGPRPTISYAPTGTPYGGTLSVDTPDLNVTRAALVAPNATTHANDMNQRYVALSVTPRAGGVNLAVPTSANVAPPGYYMLFLINSSGVPSVATWVRVGAGLPQPPVNSAPPTLTGTPAPGGTVSEASPGTWSGTAVSFTRQWLRCNTFGESCSGIAGATGTSYVVTTADVGSTLRLRVTGSNASGTIPADSAPTGVVPATPACTACGSGGPGCTTCVGEPSKDTIAPKLSFSLPSRRTLKALLKSGLTLRVKCSEVCTLSAVLDLHVTVSTKAGKKTKRRVKVYILARKSASASKAGKAVTVRIKLTRSGKSRLRRVKPRNVRLTLTAKDKAGNGTKRSRTIRVLR